MPVSLSLIVSLILLAFANVSMNQLKPIGLDLDLKGGGSNRRGAIGTSVPEFRELQSVLAEIELRINTANLCGTVRTLPGYLPDGETRLDGANHPSIENVA